MIVMLHGLITLEKMPILISFSPFDSHTARLKINHFLSATKMFFWSQINAVSPWLNTRTYWNHSSNDSLTYLKGLSILLLWTLGHSHLELTVAKVHLIVKETSAEQICHFSNYVIYPHSMERKNIFWQQRLKLQLWFHSRSKE